MPQSPANFGIVGALRAFPQRLAARAVASRGGRLRRGVTRQTTRIVIGGKLLDKLSDAEIARRIAALRASGTKLLSENGFLRWLHQLEVPGGAADLSRQSLIDQSRLDPQIFDMLA